MLIFKDLIVNWKSGAFQGLADPEYAGPVALAGGGGTTVQNETVPTGPWGPQIPYIMQLFDNANSLYNQGPPQAYGTEDGAQLTPDVNQNIQGTYDAVGPMAGQNIDQNQWIQSFLQQFGGAQNPGAQVGQNLVPGIYGGIGEQLGAGSNALSQFGQSQLGNAGGAYGNVFGQTPSTVGVDPTQGGTTDVSGALGQQLAGGGGQNPYLESLVQSAMQGQADSFNRNVLPGIRSEAAQAGQVGGTRHGIAEGIAAGDYQNQERLTRESLYGQAFGQQANLQGQAVNNVMRAQSGDQSAGLQASGLTNQNYQNYINSLLQGAGQVQDATQGGLGLGYDAIGTGTAQAGNLFGQGNSLQLQQTLQSLGMIPGFQAGSLGQLGAMNSLGMQQYGLGQNNIDALMNQYYYNQNSPFNLLSQYQQYISGPYGSTVYPQGYGLGFDTPGAGYTQPYGGPTYPNGGFGNTQPVNPQPQP